MEPVILQLPQPQLMLLLMSKSLTPLSLCLYSVKILLIVHTIVLLPREHVLSSTGGQNTIGSALLL